MEYYDGGQTPPRRIELKREYLISGTKCSGNAVILYYPVLSCRAFSPDGTLLHPSAYTTIPGARWLWLRLTSEASARLLRALSQVETIFNPGIVISAACGSVNRHPGNAYSALTWHKRTRFGNAMLALMSKNAPSEGLTESCVDQESWT